MIKVFRKIKYAFQRFKYGISDYDLMDFDMWFLQNMPIILTRFKNKKLGWPCGYFENEFYELNKDRIDPEIYNKIKIGRADAYSISDEFGHEFDAYTESRWDQELDKMIHLFNECKDESPKNEYQEKCKEEALALFVKYFDGLWW